MLASELIQKLQALVEEHGDGEVGYVDNGPFAENGGWVEADPQPSIEWGADAYGNRTVKVLTIIL